MKVYRVNAVEHFVSHGENAHYEQFSFLKQCFQMLSTTLYVKIRLRVDMKGRKTFNCPCFTGNVIINMYAFCTKCHFTIHNFSLILSHIQQTYSRQLWNHTDKRGNCLFWAFSSLCYNVFKVFCCKGVRKRLYKENC